MDRREIWSYGALSPGGYNMVFRPLADGKASRKFIVFADGFAGAWPIRAPAFRSSGRARWRALHFE
jgi:hypothetical protein